MAPNQAPDNTNEVGSWANETPLHGDPPTSDLGDGLPEIELGGGLTGPMTSIDDIDPNVCNWVHNLTACESDSALVARERLAELTGADVARIYVLDVEIALWPDASLGVPQPDALYAQVETPGYLVILSPAEGEPHADDPFEYHTDLNGNVVLAKGTDRQAD